MGSRATCAKSWRRRAASMRSSRSDPFGCPALTTNTPQREPPRRPAQHGDGRRQVAIPDVVRPPTVATPYRMEAESSFSSSRRSPSGNSMTRAYCSSARALRAAVRHASLGRAWRQREQCRDRDRHGEMAAWKRERRGERYGEREREERALRADERHEHQGREERADQRPKRRQRIETPCRAARSSTRSTLSWMAHCDTAPSKRTGTATSPSTPIRERRAAPIWMRSSARTESLNGSATR